VKQNICHVSCFYIVHHSVGTLHVSGTEPGGPNTVVVLIENCIAIHHIIRTKQTSVLKFVNLKMKQGLIKSTETRNGITA